MRLIPKNIADDSFITGLNSPQGIAIDAGNLYVANRNSGTISKYDLATGATIDLDRGILTEQL